MKYDYTELKKLIVRKFGTYENFGDEIGYSPANISHRFTGHVRMSQDDIDAFATALRIKPTQYGRYFFTKKV